MTAYEIARTVHVACAVATAAGFAWRGGLMLAGSPVLRARWVRIAPHIVDTTLPVAAVTMLVTAQIDLRHAVWLQVKIAGLLVYVALGSMALRRARAWAFAGALAALGTIFAVALNRSIPWPS